MAQQTQPDGDERFEAHVAFEVARLSGAGLEAALAAEAAAVLDWLAEQRLGDLVDPAEVAGAVARLADAMPGDALAVAFAQAVGDAQGRLAREGVVLGDLVAAPDLDALVSVVAGMEELRDDVLDVVIGSKAYARLVAHVLYHGLKSYVLTENVLARSIPGASSLVRLGRRGLSSAAPGLEAGVDRQLTGFVQGNVADTLRESRRFLQESLDAAALAELAAEAREAVADREIAPVGEAVAEQREELARTLVALVDRLREAGLLRVVVTTVVEAALRRRRDQPVRDVLAELGITAEQLAADASRTLVPAVLHARDTGFLEARVRAWLQPFYDGLRSAPTP